MGRYYVTKQWRSSSPIVIHSMNTEPSAEK
jgi:hypothetical protein